MGLSLVLTLSNKISLSRILFIPPLVFCITQVQHHDHYRYACLFIMFIIGLSDMLDGYVARKRNEMTNLGKYLDPFADKLVVIISCSILSSDRIWPEPRFPNWIPTIIICRDLFLILGTVVLLIVTGRITCRPILLGKVSTGIQIIAVISILIGNHVPLPALITIWWTTVVFTSASGLLYMYEGVKQL